MLPTTEHCTESELNWFLINYLPEKPKGHQASDCTFTVCSTSWWPWWWWPMKRCSEHKLHAVRKWLRVELGQSFNKCSSNRKSRAWWWWPMKRCSPWGMFGLQVPGVRLLQSFHCSTCILIIVIMVITILIHHHHGNKLWNNIQRLFWVFPENSSKFGNTIVP